MMDSLAHKEAAEVTVKEEKAEDGDTAAVFPEYDMNIHEADIKQECSRDSCADFRHVGDSTTVPRTDCCKRCAYVRDCYIRRRGKPGTGSGGEAAKKRSDLSFLDSIPSSQRNPITNVVLDELHESEITEGTQADVEENISHIDRTENMTRFNCNTHNKKYGDNNKGVVSKYELVRGKKKKKLTHSEERLQLLKEIARRNATPAQNKLDETDLFFNSMAKIVKKLPRREQIQLRMQIASWVDNAELRRIEIESRPTNSFIKTKLNTER